MTSEQHEDEHLADIIPLDDGNRNRFFRFRVQTAYVGRECAYCGEEYTSVDNFLGREPKRGSGNDIVDAFCWEDYVKLVMF